MGISTTDEDLLCHFDVRRFEGFRPVEDELVDEDGRQGVDKPRLAAREVPGQGAGLVGERLPGLGRMLSVERVDLFRGEIAQGQGVAFDVEGRRATGTLGVGVPLGGTRGGQLVVADVPEADQCQGVGSLGRPAGIGGVKLVEDREKGVADQGVDLVQEEDDGTRAAFAPELQVSPQSEHGGGVRDFLRLRWAKLGGQLVQALQAQGVDDGLDTDFDVIAGGAAGLATGKDGGVSALGGQRFGEQPCRRRLAALARCVDDKPGLPVDQRAELGEAALRLNHVVLRGAAHPGDVEEALHASIGVAVLLFAQPPLVLGSEVALPDEPAGGEVEAPHLADDSDGDDPSVRDRRCGVGTEAELRANVVPQGGPRVAVLPARLARLGVQGDDDFVVAVSVHGEEGAVFKEDSGVTFA